MKKVLKQGVCSVCGRTVFIKRDGTPYMHDAARDDTVPGTGGRCKGSYNAAFKPTPREMPVVHLTKEQQERLDHQRSPEDQ